MTSMANNDISYIQEIQKKLSESAWYELNWYLLHHKDIDLRTGLKLQQTNDAEYNKWLETHNLIKINPTETIKGAILPYITDYINTIDIEEDANVQEHFEKKEQDMEFLKNKDPYEEKVEAIKKEQMLIETTKYKLRGLSEKERKEKEEELALREKKLQEEISKLVKQELEKIKTS